MLTGEPPMVAGPSASVSGCSSASITRESPMLISAWRILPLRSCIRLRSIAVAASERRVGPVDGVCAMKQCHGALEATNAAEGFGRQTDFVAEQADEAARTEAGLIDHVGDAARAPAKRGQRMADSGMTGMRPLQQGQQRMHSRHAADGHALAAF